MSKPVGSAERLAVGSMPIEGLIGVKQAPLQLHRYPTTADLERSIALMESRPEAIVYLESDLEHFDRIRTSLCLLRAQNVSAVLLLTKSEPPLNNNELESVLPFLRDWDQLFLYNIMVLFDGWIADKFKKHIDTEIKIELKWFREWLVANQDSRISRYPGLPWRSYMRKVIGENFDFAQTLLTVGGHLPPEQRKEDLTIENLVLAYLKSRKKAICFFPKKWGRLQ